LDDSIETAGKLLCVIHKWDEPTSLSRIWCLFELWRAIVKNRPIKMAFSAQEAARFVTAVREERASVEEVVERVNVNEAQASVEADLVRIRAQIDESVGTDGFHAALQQKLMAALSLTVVHAPADYKTGLRSPPRAQPRRLLVQPAAREGEDEEEKDKDRR
jgi:hypothetical protein